MYKHKNKQILICIVKLNSIQNEVWVDTKLEFRPNHPTLLHQKLLSPNFEIYIPFVLMHSESALTKKCPMLHPSAFPSG